MPLTFLLPSSLGEFRAGARAELLEPWLSAHLGERVRTVVARTYDYSLIGADSFERARRGDYDAQGLNSPE